MPLGGELGDVGHPVHGLAHVCEQGQPVFAQPLILDHDHHRIEERIHRLLQRRKGLQVSGEVSGVKKRLGGLDRILQSAMQRQFGGLRQRRGVGVDVGLAFGLRLPEDVCDPLVRRGQACGLWERTELPHSLKHARQQV